MEERKALPLLAFNHVSRVCADLSASFKFYTEVLGFEQAASLEVVERCLAAWGIAYVKNVFVEEGIQVGQLFFHDPDRNMIEVCNCDELPLVRLSEGALACAARPLQRLRSLPLPVPLPVPPPAAGSEISSSDASSSDVGSYVGSSSDDHMSDHATDGCCRSCGATASLASPRGLAAPGALAEAAARRHRSFSSSSGGGGADTSSASVDLDMSALSLGSADLEDWPALAHGYVRSAAASGEGACEKEAKGGEEREAGAAARSKGLEVSGEAVSVHALAAGLQ